MVEERLRVEADRHPLGSHLPNAVYREDLVARPARQVTANEHIARTDLAENPPQLFPPLDLLLSGALDLDPHLHFRPRSSSLRPGGPSFRRQDLSPKEKNLSRREPPPACVP
jgi:hypothetical protein